MFTAYTAEENRTNIGAPVSYPCCTRVVPVPCLRMATPDYLGARAPPRLRERILRQFQSAENIKWLRTPLTRLVPEGPLLDFALDTLQDAVYAFEQGEDHISSDPLGMRSKGVHGAVNFWDEVRRLNTAFVESRLRFLREHGPTIDSQRNGPMDDDEPYHMRAFIADSLRPPGLEHLNDEPLWAIVEDRVAAGRRPSAVRSAVIPADSVPIDTDTGRTGPIVYESFTPGCEAKPPGADVGVISTARPGRLGLGPGSGEPNGRTGYRRVLGGGRSGNISPWCPGGRWVDLR